MREIIYIEIYLTIANFNNILDILNDLLFLELVYSH